VCGSVRLTITVLKTVTRKRLLKSEKTLCVLSYSDIWSVWFRKTVIITVLKSSTRKRLVKTEDFCVSCGYSDIWSVWSSGTVVVARSGDPLVASGPDIQSDTPSRDPLARDSI
jgi:hypothetical protein